MSPPSKIKAAAGLLLIFVCVIARVSASANELDVVFTANHRIAVDPRDPTKFILINERQPGKLSKRADGSVWMPSQLPAEPRWFKPCPVPKEKTRVRLHSLLPRVDSTTVQSILEDEQHNIKLEAEAHKRAMLDRHTRSISESFLRSWFPSSKVSPMTTATSRELVTINPLGAIELTPSHYQNGHGHHQNEDHDTESKYHRARRQWAPRQEFSQQESSGKKQPMDNFTVLVDLMEQIKNCSYRIHWHSYKTFMKTEDIRITLEAIINAISQYIADDKQGDNLQEYLSAKDYWLPDVNEMMAGNYNATGQTNNQQQLSLVQQLLNNNLTLPWLPSDKDATNKTTFDERVSVIINSSHYLQCFGVATEQLILDSPLKRFVVTVKENKTDIKKSYPEAIMDLDNHLMNVLCEHEVLGKYINNLIGLEAKFVNIWRRLDVTETSQLLNNDGILRKLEKTDLLFEKLKHSFQLQSPFMKKYAQIYQTELAKHQAINETFVPREIWPDSGRQDRSARRDFKIFGILQRFISEYRQILEYFANEYGEKTLYTTK